MAKRPPVKPLTPDVVADKHLQAFEEAWWQKRTLADTGMSLSAVVLEFQYQVCAYIVGRLRDPQTPEAIKDSFAMRGMPNLGVIFKNPDATGSLGFGAGPHMPALEAPRPEGAVPNVSSVLEAYRTAGKIPH